MSDSRYKSFRNKSSRNKTVSFTFQGRQESLDIIDDGKEIVSYLSTLSSDCPLIGSDIVLESELEPGPEEIVFSVSIKGMGPKKYIAKRSVIKIIIEKYFLPGRVTLEHLAGYIERTSSVSASAIIAVNGGNPDKILSRDKDGDMSIFVPEYAYVCKTKVDKKYKGKSGDVVFNTLIPKGSYLCENNQYSEYINSVLCAKLYRLGVSANFIDVFSFITCPPKKENKNGYQYIFMEKVGMSMEEYISNEEDSLDMIIETILIQIAHAIATYQRYYKLQHNNLSDKNIFIEKINSKTQFNDQNIIDCDYFHYSIDNIDLYLPNLANIIVKIGNFGMSVKYSEPIVGDKQSVSTGYNKDMTGPLIPNWYAENYDFLTILFHLFGNHRNDSFLTEVMKKISKQHSISQKIDSMFDIKTSRPRINKLNHMKQFTPTSFLKDKSLLRNYMEKPSHGKIVTLGSI